MIKTEQTPEEFHEYFKDIAQFKVNKTFEKDDVLSFVSLQPQTLILEPNKLRELTQSLFKSIKYVEVIERNYEVNERCNYANFIDGYHSHLIVKEEDYIKIEEQLKGLDIVEKVAYDLERLIRKYLSKQAGVIHERLLPTNHIPMPVVKVIRKVVTPVGKAIDATINLVVETINKVIQPAALKAMMWFNSIINKFILPEWKWNFNHNILRQVVDDT